MKIKCILMSFIGFFFLVNSSWAANGIAELSPAEVKMELQSNEVLILDANLISIYKKGHLPKSKNIKFSDFDSELPKNKNARIIFYCMSEMCTASHQAAQHAVKLGYTNVARMPAGIRGWIKSGYAVEE